MYGLIDDLQDVKKENKKLKKMIKQLLEAMGNATFQSFDDQIKLLCKKASEMVRK